MKDPQVLQQAAAFIRENDDFLLLTHEHPDGDAIGSSLAMACVLKKLGKRYTLVNDDPLPEKFLFLPAADQYRIPAEVGRTFSRCITLDCGDRRRLGQSGSLLKEDALLLNVDHHVTNDHFASCNVVDTNAAATAQVVYQIVKELRVELDPSLALCLYTGLLTDTGGFRYSNTTPLVHQMAAELLATGIDPYVVADRMLESMTWGKIQLLRSALATLKRDETGKVAWMLVTRDMLESTNATEDDVEGLVNYTRNLEGVEVGILFRERLDGQVKVSLRSKFHVDVSSIAQSLGGGGHNRAAGCTLHTPLTEAASLVLARVKDAMSR